MNASTPAATQDEPASIVVAIVLDHEARGDAEDAKLAELAAWLFAGGVSSLTLFGAGAARPETWRVKGGALRIRREVQIGGGAGVRHFAGDGASLTLLPQGAGRDVVLAAARRYAAERGSGEVSVAGLDAIIDGIAGPAPDLVIVTGGKMNLNSGLTWHAAYAEFVFLAPSWSALTVSDAAWALEDFAARGRRFGGLETE